MTTHFGRYYELHEHLGTGGMGVVHRAVHRVSSEVVALKRVLGTKKGAEFALAREFWTLASLRHPNIVSVLDYGFVGATPFFTMELLPKPTTLATALSGQSVGAFVERLVELLRALQYLHRRGVLHRDIKPSNILCAEGHLKLADFGIAKRIEEFQEPQGAQRQGALSGPAGTLFYMAPELLTGGGASIESDLYALGMMSYQILTGRLPFHTTSLVKWVESLLQSDPDYSVLLQSLETDQIPTSTDTQPSASASTQEAIDSSESEIFTLRLTPKPMPTWRDLPPLARIIQKLLHREKKERYHDVSEVVEDLRASQKIRASLETRATRESLLQAATFVGRSKELDTLREVLKDAEEGRGSVWLLGGESGVGKSRMLDETRTLALIRGSLVLRGQCSREQREALGLFRQILRWLSVLSEPSDQDAMILALFVPKLSEMLGRPLPPAPPLTPAALNTLILFVLESLFARYLNSQQTPTIFLLEDLQWASEEELALLKRLIDLSASRPLVVLATYRSEERPELPQGLAGAKSLKLSRLGEEATARLGESMLGALGKHKGLSGWLHQETEGNAFFIVEVMRTLAEQAGELQKINPEDLPQRLFVGGVREAIVGRLKRVSLQTRTLLDAAAVSGRAIDQKLLSLLSSEALTPFLEECEQRAIIEFYEGAWRFSHDKIREAILEELSPSQRQALHTKIAASLTAEAYGSQAEPSTLAYHYRGANDPNSEYPCAVAAAEKALQKGAASIGVSFLRRALEIIPGEDEREELRVLTLLAPTLINTYGYSTPEVQKASERAHKLAKSLGNFNQLFFSLYSLFFFALTAKIKEEALLIAKEMHTLAQEKGDLALVAESCDVLSVIYICLGRFPEAEAATRQGEENYDPMACSKHLLFVAQHVGVGTPLSKSLALWHLGACDDSLEAVQLSRARAKEIGHLPSTCAALCFSAWLHLLRGEPDEMLRYLDEADLLAKEAGLNFWLLFSALYRGIALIEKGFAKEGAQMIEQALPAWRILNKFMTTIFCLHLGKAYIAQGEVARALATFDEGLAHAAHYKEQHLIPELRRFKAQLLFQREETREEARQELLLAISKAKEQSSKMYLLRALRTQVEHAEGALREGAIDELLALRRSLQQGQGSPDLVAADALLSQYR
jgi:serine/threonine protein kinase